MHKIIIPLAPMRTSPLHKAEMCNELLYGESVELIDTIKEWAEVACIDYEYRGWILADAIEPCKDEKAEKRFLFSETGTIDIAGTRMSIPKGSILRDEDTLEGDAHPAVIFDSELIISLARQYLNAPYRWGGRSPFGIDCSGFTQIVFMLTGIQIPRDASKQAEIGKSVAFVQEAQSGDLAFFGDREDSITHVGIIMDNNKIIHASGKVRIDKLDHQGIYNSETKKYSHKLRIIKRFEI